MDTNTGFTEEQFAEQVEAATEFLAEVCRPIKTINRRRSSYGLKHVAESWHRERGQHRYVSNEAFIAAAHSLGFQSSPIPNSSSRYFNLSVRGLVKR